MTDLIVYDLKCITQTLEYCTPLQTKEVKMKYLYISTIALLALPVYVDAQSTDCNPNGMGGFTCSPSPLSNLNNNSIDFLGSYQRGIDAANQRIMIEQQIEIQRQLMEQQRQLRIQQQIKNQTNEEYSTSEWQIGNLTTREEGKLPNGMSRCVYHSPSEYFYIKGKRYGAYITSIEKDEKCPLSLHVSKSTGDKR